MGAHPCRRHLRGHSVRQSPESTHRTRRKREKTVANLLPLFVLAFDEQFGRGEGCVRAGPLVDRNRGGSPAGGACDWSKVLHEVHPLLLLFEQCPATRAI